MGHLTFLLWALAGLTLSAAQICPPVEVLSPCNCSESTKSIECIGIRGRFNLKQVFDNAAGFVNDDTIFDSLRIEGNNQILEIEEGAIQHLKFHDVNIGLNENLVYISSRAFNASQNVTRRLDLRQNYIDNGAPYERDIFEFVRNFVNLERLTLTNNRLSSIPDDAFQNLNSLEEINLGNNRISHIGSRAFSQVPKLSKVVLSWNAVPSGGLLEDVFDGISEEVSFDLTYNGMEFFEQKSFQPLLDKTNRIVEIGGRNCSPNGCSYQRLHCDERADWICDKSEEYQDKLIGFMCIAGTGYGNLWQYCEGKNGTAH